MVETITRGSRVFGGTTQGVSTPSNVPAQAFGDSAGQLRMAESVANASGTVMDIAVRETKMQQAEENSQLTRLNTEFGLREKKTRLEAARMFREGELESPDAKLQFYDEQMQATEDELFGSKDFKTISKDTIMDISRQNRENYQLQYRAGELEADRLTQFKGNLANTLDSLVESAALAGSDRDINKLSAHVNEILAVTGTPEYMTTHPDFEVRRDAAIGEAVQGFLRTMSDEPGNIDDVIALLDDKNSFFGQAIDADTRVGLKEKYVNKKRKLDNIEQEAINKQNIETTQTMKLGIIDGDVARIDIDNSGLPDGNKVQLITFLESRRAKSVAAKAGFTDVEATLAGGSSMQYDAANRKAVDRWSNQFEQEIVDLPFESKNELRAEKYAQIGYIPDSMTNKITRSLLVDGDNNEVEEAVAILKGVQGKNMWATQRLPDDVNATMELINAGLPVDKTREVINRKSQMTDVEQNYWKNQSKEMIGDNPEDFIVETINDVFNWDFDESAFAVPPAAQSEFRALLDANMILTQSPDIAKSMAARQLVSPNRSGRGGWGRTLMDGTERLMKYSPEVMYETANSEIQSELLREDMQREMRSELKLEPGEYILEFNRGSLKDGKFNYYVWQTKNDIMQPVTDGAGNVVKWHPPAQTDRARNDREIERLNKDRMKLMFRIDKTGRESRAKIDARLKKLGAD